MYRRGAGQVHRARPSAADRPALARGLSGLAPAWWSSPGGAPAGSPRGPLRPCVPRMRRRSPPLPRAGREQVPKYQGNPRAAPLAKQPSRADRVRYAEPDEPEERAAAGSRKSCWSSSAWPFWVRPAGMPFPIAPALMASAKALPAANSRRRERNDRPQGRGGVVRSRASAVRRRRSMRDCKRRGCGASSSRSFPIGTPSGSRRPQRWLLRTRTRPKSASTWRGRWLACAARTASTRLRPTFPSSRPSP